MTQSTFINIKFLIMRKSFSNLLATTQKAVELTAITLIVLATLGIAFIALAGLFASLVWIAELCENIPEILHSATKFVVAIEELPLATLIPWESIPTIFWAFPIKLQGIIMAFLGALSFIVLSYTAEWLNVLLNVILTTPQITFANPKLQIVSKLVEQWWSLIIQSLRKLTTWIVIGIGGSAILYLIWNTLARAYPM
ncbi:MAG: hypothetical protein NC218_07940 [Acetobacter sp.]|nr:hypothetical protein [Acetobacter sp.]